MPLTVQDGAVLGAGVWAAGLATLYFRKKQTLPFKAAYFAAWPLLGTAAIWIATPTYEGMEKALKKDGVETDASLLEHQHRSQLQMDSLRKTAGR